MASDTKKQVAVSGIVPVASGEDWFAIDESGTFTVDKTITATIWLVGGGCDGSSGEWIGYDTVQKSSGYWEVVEGTGVGTSYAGKGGDGGYVFTAVNVKIPKGMDCAAAIALANDQTGTSLEINGVIYNCDDSGSVCKVGGSGGGVELSTSVIHPTDGENGVDTPFQVVGSSGGGGLACNGFNSAPNDGNVSRVGQGGTGAGSTTEHRSPGTDAVNYGCGGGGGAICGQIGQGQLGGNGKQGCIIVSYTIDEENNTLVVERRYTKKTTVTKKCDVNYAVSQNNSHCCGNPGNSGCGCGHRADNELYSNGVVVENFTDEVNIKGNISAAEIMAKIETLQAENSALLQQIQELENRLNVN